MFGVWFQPKSFIDVFYHQIRNGIQGCTTRAPPLSRGGTGRTGDQTIASPMPWPLGHDIPQPTLYSLWQLSNQYCSRSKKVLRTADMLVASLGVTSSWGSTYHAAGDARRVDTVQGCDYYSTYDTIISLMTYIIDIITK